MTLPLVTELEQTCEISPSQWEGKAEDGQFVYIRYRWGWLEIGVDKTMNQAVVNRERVAQLGDKWDGYITQSEMMKAAGGFLAFAEASTHDS